MDRIEIGHGTNLHTDFKNTIIKDENFDIQIFLQNGEVISINTRKKGYAIKIKNNKLKEKTLINHDY